MYGKNPKKMGLLDRVPFFRKRLLRPQEEERIVRAIQKAEKQTSAEIRVVVETECPGDPVQRAIERFEQLGMTATKQRNGVLIYISLKDRKYAVVGDVGIHEKVGEKFWETVAEEMRSILREGKVVEAVIRGVERTGEVLAKYFPYEPGKDRNELPDEVAY